MILRQAMLLIFVVVIITSCKSENQQYENPVEVAPATHYEYMVGLGYGFLGKAVQITIDGREVISVVGTNEIEQHAQLQGTKMLASGSSPKKEIMVGVLIDGKRTYEETIDLSYGMYVHIYQERAGLRVYNTHFLVYE